MVPNAILLVTILTGYEYVHARVESITNHRDDGSADTIQIGMINHMCIMEYVCRYVQ